MIGQRLSGATVDVLARWANYGRTISLRSFAVLALKYQPIPLDKSTMQKIN